MLNYAIATATVAATSLAEAFSGVDFSVMTTDLYAIIPVVMVPCLTWLGLRKATNFGLGILRSC